MPFPAAVRPQSAKEMEARPPGLVEKILVCQEPLVNEGRSEHDLRRLEDVTEMQSRRRGEDAVANRMNECCAVVVQEATVEATGAALPGCREKMASKTSMKRTRKKSRRESWEARSRLVES